MNDGRGPSIADGFVLVVLVVVVLILLLGLLSLCGVDISQIMG